MATQQLKSIARDLDKAGVIMARAAVQLGQLGHSKAGEVERLRARLNIIIINLQPNERATTRPRSGRAGQSTS